MHIQERTKTEWESAADEQHLQGLFDRAPFVNPAWMNWLERNRPHLIAQYLNLHQQSGGYVGRPAKRWLNRHG